MALNAKILPDDEFFFGHKACAGCGGSLAVRAALKVLGPNAVAALPAGCMSAVGFNFPQLSFANNAMITPFAATASVLTGIEAGLRAQGIKSDDCTVVGFAGDGGTADIGLQALSGAIDRNDDVLYICYDNEAYMNTGVQRSGATPPTARTATTQPVGENPGNRFGQGKDMARIAMAHEIPYVATATVADLRDLEYKVNKAMSYHGARYIHVLVPCPLGWGAASNITVKLARLATQTGLFPVFEAEGGEITSVTKIRRPTPVEEYLRPQRRFAHLFKGGGDPETLARLQAIADRNIRRYGLIDADQLDEDVLDRVLRAPEDPEGRFTDDETAK